MNPAHYAKFVVAVLGVIVGALAAAVADGAITVDEAVNLAVVALGAIATYVVPNLEEGIGKHAKLIVGALTAGATLLASLTTDGITLSEWLMVGAAILTAITTWIIPNAPELVAIGQHTDGTTTAVYATAHPAMHADGGDPSAGAGFPPASA